MKINRGFVAVKPDGMYLHISTHQGKQGQHVDVAAVADIDDATVRFAPACRDRNEAAVLRPLNVSWQPVEVRREVVPIFAKEAK